MRAQRVQLGFLRERLSLDAVHHAALLPAKYAATLEGQLPRSGPDAFPIVLWEDVLGRYGAVREEGDYFLGMLAAALERWDELAARPSVYRANAEQLLTGAEILQAARNGDSKVRVVGRRGGLFGPTLAADISSGKWLYRKYEVSSTPPLLGSNPNWFTVEEFVARVKKTP